MGSSSAEGDPAAAAGLMFLRPLALLCTSKLYIAIFLASLQTRPHTRSSAHIRQIPGDFANQDLPFGRLRRQQSSRDSGVKQVAWLSPYPDLTEATAPKGTRPPAAGKGRPKGARNKMTRALKDMILQALDDAGGQQYLVEQAHKNPAAFMTLLGKVLPLQVSGAPGGDAIVLKIVKYDGTS